MRCVSRVARRASAALLRGQFARGSRNNHSQESEWSKRTGIRRPESCEGIMQRIRSNVMDQKDVAIYGEPQEKSRAHLGSASLRGGSVWTDFERKGVNLKRSQDVCQKKKLNLALAVSYAPYCLSIGLSGAERRGGVLEGTPPGPERQESSNYTPGFE